MKLLLEYQQNPRFRTAYETLQQAEAAAREVYTNEKVSRTHHRFSGVQQYEQSACAQALEAAAVLAFSSRDLSARSLTALCISSIGFVR